MFAIAGFSTAAMAEDNGDVAGHVLRARDSQPIAEVPVQIKETGAKATTNAQGAYTFSHLPPGAYTLIVTPSGDGVIQRKISVTAGEKKPPDNTGWPQKRAAAHNSRFCPHPPPTPPRPRQTPTAHTGQQHPHHLQH